MTWNGKEERKITEFQSKAAEIFLSRVEKSFGVCVLEEILSIFSPKGFCCKLYVCLSYRPEADEDEVSWRP